MKSWDNWHAGGELSFKVECDRLRGLPPFNVQERSAQKMAGTSIFAGENGAGRNAWARNLYRRLSEYVHARGTNAGLWESTGPIYSANGFSLANHFFLETHALGVLLVKTAEQSVLIGDAARHLLSDQNLGSYLEAAHQQVCAFYVSKFWIERSSSVAFDARQARGVQPLPIVVNSETRILPVRRSCDFREIRLVGDFLRVGNPRHRRCEVRRIHVQAHRSASPDRMGQIKFARAR